VRTQTVILSGREFVIRELPLKKNAEWRMSLSREFMAVAGVLSEAEQLEVKREDAAAVFGLLRRAGEMAVESPGVIIDLVFAYAPELRSVDRDEVYESELMDAFGACLRLAFPFGRALDLLRQLAIDGSETAGTATSQNSGQPAMATSSG
jgi:hypothetical protein